MEHHEATIAAYVDAESAREDVLGVVLTGSVARGSERPDSDVDVYLVVTEEAFDQAVHANRLSYVDSAVSTYDGGYVDIKVASLEYLTAAGERGDDPVRASFAGARVVWTRVDDLAERIARIPELAEEVWAAREASFLAAARLHGGYFMRQGHELDNHFLRHHAAVHLVGAGGRAILALNRTLYAGQKYLDQTIARLPRRPEEYAELAAAVLEQPSPTTATAYLEALEALHRWPLDRESTLSTFVRDNELAWLTRTPPPEYS